MEVATATDGSVVVSPPTRSAPQMFTEASGLDLTGSHFTNVSGDMHIHHHATASTSTSGPPPVSQGSRSQVLPAPSRQDVLYSDSESYCSQLLRCGRGFPLYLPGPGGNLPQEYQRHGVSIGDVGRVTPEGAFDFFFNIYLPVDDPVNAIGTPENFCPLTPSYDSADMTPLEYSAEDYVSTRSSLVKLDTRPQPIDFSAMESFVFDCCGPQGAVLTIPLGSRVEKLVNLENMLRYARENAESWYKYANGARGRRLTNGSLYLVTGWEKALAWGRASFQDLSAQSTFRLAFEPTPTASPGPGMDDRYNYKYRWTAAGPARTKSYGSLPQTTPLNQTLFIHGYSISLGSSIWGKFFKDVQISQIVDARLGRHNKDWVPYGPQGFSISWALGFSGGGGSGRETQYAGEQQGSAADDVGIAELAPSKQLFRPSQVINDYILRKCPDAEVVMTHDDDWRDILQQSDDSATYSDKAAIELLYRACEALTLVEEDGLATIRRPDPAGHAETLLSSDSVPADPREQIANSSPRGEAQIRSSDDVEPSHVDLLGESVPVSVAAIEEGLQAANANLMGTSAASSSRSSVHSEGKRRQEKETEENIRDEDSLASPEIGLHEAGGSPTLPEAQSEVDEGSRRPTPFPDFEGPGASRSEEKRRADDSPIQSAQTPGVQDASSTDGQGWRLDLSTVISLVWKLFKGCRDSSQDFERLANELGALHVALTETRDYMEEYGENYGEELPGHRIERLVMILETCQTALDELDTLHSQYQNLSTQAQRSWNRLRYGQKDLSGIRTTLISTATMLTSFNAILLTTSTARIEKKLQKFLQEVEAGKREGSVVTVQEDDWTVDSVNVWDQVRRELEDVGISPEVVEERHEFILSWVKQAMTEGMIPDVGSTDSLLAPIGDVDEDQGPLERPPTPIPTDAANEKEFISTAARLFGVDKGSTAGPSTIGEQNAPIVDLPGPSTEASSVYSFSTSSSKTLRNSSSRSSIFSISTFTSSKKGSSKPRKRILGLIRKLFQKQTAIVKAASEGDIERVERLIKMGMNVNAVDRWGWSALSMCAYGGHAAITRLLLENGADIDNIDVDGDTPLLLATQRGHNEVVALLEEASTEKVRMRASDSSNPVKY